MVSLGMHNLLLEVLLEGKTLRRVHAVLYAQRITAEVVAVGTPSFGSSAATYRHCCCWLAAHKVW